MVETNTLRRLAGHAGRIRPGRARASRSTSIAGELAREAAESFADGRHRWVVGSIGPGTKLPTPGQHRLRPAGGGAGRTVPRPDRRRRRRHPDRDLPGHAADQGRGQRRQDRPRRGRHRHADLRAGDGGNHRHAAGRPRHRRRRHRGARAGRAADRAELRHRPAGNGRACALARRQLAGPALGAAQCRPAGTGRRPDALSARRRRDWRAGWSASSPRTASI